jgi:glycine betaine/proline transport system ATP-binding protein
MKTKVKARNVYRIFGSKPDYAMDMLKSGSGKEAILEETGMTVGVNDVGFDVGEGEIFVVMGLSGSGKSTLIRMINGLIKPTSGEILVDGDDVANCSAETLRRVRRNKVAMVFQHFALLPHKTVRENVAYGLKIKGVGAEERDARAETALGQVGLSAYADSYPDELSGGMQQRVGLARGLANDPEVLLMDEPFSALDPLIRRDMQDELLDLQRSLKKTIIFITHDLNEALTLGDKIAIMKDGRFVQVGTAQEIVDNPADDYVQAFTADIDRSRVFTAGSVAVEPVTVDLATDSARVAIARMEDANLDALYVLESGKPVGAVTYRDLSTAVREGNVTMRDVLLRDFPKAGRSTQLFELYGLAEQGLPIAVTGRDGRLVGVVSPEAVFAKLSPTPAAAA